MAGSAEPWNIPPSREVNETLRGCHGVILQIAFSLALNDSLVAWEKGYALYIAEKQPPESNLLSVTHHQIRTTESSRETFFSLWDSRKKNVFYLRNIPRCCSKELSKRNLFWGAFLSFASSFSWGFLSTTKGMSQLLWRAYKMPNTGLGVLCKLCHVIQTILWGRTIISVLTFPIRSLKPGDIN